MPIGTEVSVSSPLGEFVLHKDTEIPVVFLIGGTGIAPVMSMLSDIEEQKIPYKITLFYSNKTIGRMVFSKELERQSERGVITRHVRTLTQTETPPQGYQKGRINEEMITKSMTPEELSRAIFYVSGPWGMGESMRAVLKNIGVRDEQIHVKEFDLNWLKK
jgi:propane monooxygenase reductase subunit